jgi:hypothetical protein
MFILVLFMQFVFFMASMDEGTALPVAIGGAAWAALLVPGTLPQPQPAYRLLRQLPVRFGQWLWAAAAFPLLMSGLLLLITAVLAAIVDPATAYRSYAIMLGIYLGVAPLRLFMISAFPNGQQTTEFLYMLILGSAGAIYYFIRLWWPLVPLLLAANIYFYIRAAREWRCREEGLIA